MKSDHSKFINRELSWLSFNQRVLQEAADPAVPLLERLKFLGIFSSNLDEFYRVRVASHTRLLNEAMDDEKGLSPQKVLNQIQKKVLKLRDQFEEIFSNVLAELKEENIVMINEEQLNKEQRNYVETFFEEEVRPTLVPVMLSKKRAFPYLKNQVIYLAIHLSKSNTENSDHYALIELPTRTVDRFIVLPQTDDKSYVIMLDDIIRYSLPEIFSIMDFDTFSAYTIKLTRDAEFDISDDITKSFYEKIAKSIKDRHKGQIVRFVYDKAMPQDLLELLQHKTKAKNNENLIPGGRYHNARDFMGFPNLGLKKLLNKKQKVLMHPTVKPKASLFEAIKKGDFLLNYPYQSYHYVVDLLREAALDPHVKSIKITLYRLAKRSNIINALVNARRNGKQVTVVIELQARFDEEANLHYANILGDEGALIINGIPGLKVHAKLCQIVREEDGQEQLYSYISTGNFNESTAKVYSDHGLFTAHPDISGEVKRVFEFLECNYKTYKYKHLLVSPFYMRKKLSKLIKNEITIAQSGKPAYIYIKLNNLVDKKMIAKLYDASQAGVKIKMIVRGICSLVPGIPGVSENIEVISIVDKYLEHSRILLFGNGGDEKIYLSSADWMIRNLDNRIEVATPIYDPAVKQELKDTLEIQFKDNSKARIIDENSHNHYKIEEGKQPFRSQIEQYNYFKEKKAAIKKQLQQKED